MKKILNLGLGIVCLSAVISSCAKEENLTNNTREAQVYRNPHRISQATALAELKAFLDEDPATKGSKPRTIKTIEALTETVPATKSSPGGLDTTLYLVNFDNNEGYAVLAADDRISEMIIAVTEKGELHPSDFLSVKNRDITPLTYIDENGVEQVFNFYNEEEDDYYVATVSDRRIIQEFIYDYVQNELDNSGNRDGSEEPKPNQEGGSYKWVTKEYIPMMVKTLWSQTGDESLYNHYCPTLWGNKAPIGCVPLALGQIMNYHKYPKKLTLEGIAINWDLLSTVHPYGDSFWKDEDATPNQKMYVSHFLNSLRDRCGAFSITGNQTFALPKWAERELKNTFGYKNVQRYTKYREDKIIESLKKGSPVLIAAVSGIVNGHAWVIDGYRYQEGIDYRGIVGRTRTLFHCNWGWSGICNGYYASKIFRTLDGVKEFEDNWEEYYYDNKKKTEGNEDYSFWYCFRIITYDKP